MYKSVAFRYATSVWMWELWDLIEGLPKPSEIYSTGVRINTGFVDLNEIHDTRRRYFQRVKISNIKPDGGFFH